MSIGFRCRLCGIDCFKGPHAEPGRAEAAEPGKLPADSDEDDVRTLWCECDEHGIRKKDWPKVLTESWHEFFAPG